MIAVYAVDQGMDPSIAFYTYVDSSRHRNCVPSLTVDIYSVSVLNAASTFGRLVPNFFGNKIGMQDCLHLTCAMLQPDTCLF